MSLCTYLIPRQWLDGYSWNFLWTLCHGLLIQIIHLNFLHSAIPTWRLREFVRWNVEATIYDHLCMRIPNLAQPNLLRNVLLCTDLITRDWLDGNSLHFIWTLCHRSLFEILLLNLQSMRLNFQYIHVLRITIQNWTYKYLIAR
jgi:hypothetical protein